MLATLKGACGALFCFHRDRRRYRGDDYVLLKPCADVETTDLENFLKENFSDLGIGPSDISNFARDGDVIKHLLRLLPIYKQCMSKYVFLRQFLSSQCRPHMRSAAEIECQKSKRVLDTLDVVMLKLVIGDFSLSESEGVEKLLEKFSVDQSTLLEIEKLERLIDMDRQESERLMTTEVAESIKENELMCRLADTPAVPQDLPGSEPGAANGEARAGTVGEDEIDYAGASGAERADADKGEKKVAVACGGLRV